jgi:hypothetical protein
MRIRSSANFTARQGGINSHSLNRIMESDHMGSSGFFDKRNQPSVKKELRKSVE